MRQIANKVRRVASFYLDRRVATLNTERAIVSFTFDDFPKSAAHEGARVLRDRNVHGTYYVAGGLAGSVTVCGAMYTPKDIEDLLRTGHEIGCHTHDHLDLATTSRSGVIESLKRNSEWYASLFPSEQMRSFSYPFGSATPWAKRQARTCYASARSVKAGINPPRLDLDYLRANALYDRLDTEEFRQQIVELLDRAVSNSSWLIFYTHDVGKNPSRFGCTASLLEFAVDRALEAGAQVMTVGDAIGSCGSSAGRRRHEKAS